MNHALNARLHKLPVCPECGAAESRPCHVDGSSTSREPHRSRLRIAEGELLYDERVARAARRVRSVRELAAVLRSTRRTANAG